MRLEVFALTVCLIAASLSPGSVLSATGSGVYFQTSTSESQELLDARELTKAAVKLFDDGNYKEALTAAKRALKIRETVLTTDDERVVEAVGNLAAIQLALNNLDEAEGLYKRVLRTAQKRGDANSRQAANALDLLAWVHYVKGDEQQAMDDYKQALSIREKFAGPESKEVAQTLLKLAELYQFEGELTKAEPLYQRLIGFDIKAFPGANMLVGDGLNAYSCLLRKMEKPEQAEELERRIDGPATTPKLPPKKEGVLNGKALRLARPPYPLKARQHRASGTVEVRVTISETGEILHACAQSGNPLFWQVSERAAYKSVFSPTRVDGTPVKVTGVITYRFVAQN